MLRPPMTTNATIILATLVVFAVFAPLKITLSTSQSSDWGHLSAPFQVSTETGPDGLEYLGQQSQMGDLTRVEAMTQCVRLLNATDTEYREGCTAIAENVETDIEIEDLQPRHRETREELHRLVQVFLIKSKWAQSPG